VTHHFDKAMVALVALSGDLKAGDIIKTRRVRKTG